MTQSILDTDFDKNCEELVEHLKKPIYAEKTAVHINYIQNNFGNLSFDEMSNHLNIRMKYGLISGRIPLGGAVRTRWWYWNSCSL